MDGHRPTLLWEFLWCVIIFCGGQLKTMIKHDKLITYIKSFTKNVKDHSPFNIVSLLMIEKIRSRIYYFKCSLIK